jgi:hypothetical protein
MNPRSDSETLQRVARSDRTGACNRSTDNGMLLPSPVAVLSREYSETINSAKQENYLQAKKTSRGDRAHSRLCRSVKDASTDQHDSLLNSLEVHQWELASLDLDHKSHLHDKETSSATHTADSRRDLILQALSQMWHRECSPWTKAENAGDCCEGLLLCQVLQMIEESSKPPKHVPTYDRFVFLTLLSFPFRILRAPPELQHMLQSKMVGSPLYEHLSPTSFLPTTMSLARADSTPLPVLQWTACLLDGVFECQARAIPVVRASGGLMLFAIIVQDVQTPIDTTFRLDE